MAEAWRDKLRRGVVIPAHPLALNANRKLDERRQRALTRYYLAAGAGGVAVGVHTTQFEIRDPKFGLYQPVLALAMDELRSTGAIRVAGIVGPTPQAVEEAELAAGCGYHAGLLSLGALRNASIAELIAHARAVAAVIPLFGFYRSRQSAGAFCPTNSGANSFRSKILLPSRRLRSTAIRRWMWCVRWPNRETCE